MHRGIHGVMKENPQMKHEDERRMEPATMTGMQAKVTDETTSAFRRYQDLVIGNRGLWTFLKYEFFMTFLSGLGGALGIALRRVGLRMLLKECGGGLAVGRNLTLRHPRRIKLGKSVIIGDNCLLDGKGERDISIEVGDRVFIGSNTILSVHNGSICLEDHVNIGANCAIQSSGPIVIESHVIMAAYCHIVSSSRRTDRTDIPILAQGTTREGITIGEGTWLGSGTVVIDGVRIGRGCIVGAGAVVTKSLPDWSVAVGVPAKIVRSRIEDGPGRE